MAKMKKATAIVPTMLRMREELRRRIEAAAKRNARSLNTEMITRLEQSFAVDENSQRDSTILKMLVGFSSDNDQMAELSLHFMREMRGLGATEIKEIATRMGDVFEGIKQQKSYHPEGEGDAAAGQTINSATVIDHAMQTDVSELRRELAEPEKEPVKMKGLNDA